MAHSRRRSPTAAAIASALLAALILPAFSRTPVSVPPPPPLVAAESLLASPVASGAGGERFELFAPEDFAGLVAPRPRRFELFPRVRPVERSRRLLATLPYGGLIADAADQYRLDGLLLAAVVKAESGFNAGAVSPRGARGLMQLMPETAAHYGAARAEDPRANVRAGARYLRDLLRRFDDDLELALAAYNAGPGAVLRYGGVPPYRETNAYIDRVLLNYLRFHHELWLEALDRRTGGRRAG